MIRTISHSEVQDVLDCQAKHAFKYTGALTGGDALSPKFTAPQLRDGKAWGAAVAHFHQDGSGHSALARALTADADEQRAAGVYDEQEFAATLGRLTRMLDHYEMTATRIPLRFLERELLVPIPSRAGRRGSTKFRLHAFLDGIHCDEEGRIWIVEFKLRGRLQSDELIAASRQTRWYAWGWERATGTAPAGVIVDERLNAVPEVVRLNKDGSPSKVQSCLAPQYTLACETAGIVPDPETLAKLYAKVWQKRTPLLFRGHEMVEAGWQLTSAANVIRQLDTGYLYPVRNPSPMRCPSCAFVDICQTPDDDRLVDSLYTRSVPKALRPTLERRAA